MPPRQPQTEDAMLMLGEMRGQLREMVHMVNNTAAKIDALTREVIEIKGISTTVAAMEVRLTAVEASVALLKEEKQRRDGAVGFVTYFLNNWQGIAAFFALVAVILVATGRVHL